ncbi:hypothetical protein DFH08DRAFT_825982 [Mycena albidolilacea]|uniref:Uncharacterized protein n=1 Tax=Mycena albidolilacea TaxID=1033008 RepID=A0AAD6Z233_9AGAR|nr:hypothetical protein DFH08DRAFT_825982 [Mycena albidolilacea]
MSTPTTVPPTAAVNAGAGAALAQPVTIKHRGIKFPLFIRTFKEGLNKRRIGGKRGSHKDARESRALLDGIDGLKAGIKDSFTIQDKKLGQWMKTSFSQAVTSLSPQETLNSGQGSYNKSNKGYNQRNGGYHINSNSSGPGCCWYCDLIDHLMATCQYKREHIEMGYIGFENGSLRLSNGQLIPKYPENKSKEHVDDYWFA